MSEDHQGPGPDPGSDPGSDPHQAERVAMPVEANRPPVPAAGEGRLDTFGVFAHTVYLALGGVLVFAFAWALAPAIERQKQAPCAALEPEARALSLPEHPLRDLEGRETSLADLAGKFLVVNFWATYCEPCIDEWPELHQLAQRMAGRDDVVVVAVSIDDDIAKLAPFLQQVGMVETPVRVLWDPQRSLHQKFGSSKIPDTYFVDERGNIVDAFIDVRQWGKPAAQRCVESRIAAS